jgi:hypothetical protein
MAQKYSYIFIILILLLFGTLLSKPDIFGIPTQLNGQLFLIQYESLS